MEFKGENKKHYSQKICKEQIIGRFVSYKSDKHPHGQSVKKKIHTGENNDSEFSRVDII